jgi:phage terminase large subunit-like protein
MSNSINSARSLRESLNACAADGTLTALLASLDRKTIEALRFCWPLFARDDQLPPDLTESWRIWLLLGGRGAGKTRAGAEWVHALALGKSGFTDTPVGRIALVGETHADVREVMVDGVSGLRAIGAPGDRPRWVASRQRLEWPNGAIAQGFSAEDPEALRGPQFDAAWCDEAGKWRYAEETFDMLQFGLRLGARPRQVVTTTPRPTALIRRLIADPATRMSRASTAMNRFNLAPGFIDQILARYRHSPLGRQEIEGELVEERPDALFPWSLIEKAHRGKAEQPARIVVAVDPPAGGARGGRCGIVVAGRTSEGDIVVLDDASLEQASPEAWASRAIDRFHSFEADALVCEVNQGGDMVAAVLKTIDPAVPVTAVRASRGKHVRAEPVAALYAQGRVRHKHRFPELEEEMARFGADGSAKGRSPDRLDALVWAVTALHQSEPAGTPRIRRL